MGVGGGGKRTSLVDLFPKTKELEIGFSCPGWVPHLRKKKKKSIWGRQCLPKESIHGFTAAAPSFLHPSPGEVSGQGEEADWGCPLGQASS